MATILVIDDDQDFADATRLMLQQAGFTVGVALTPEDGVREVKDATPDLVVLDVMMPTGYEGFEVARTIREDLGLRDLPIVILTCLQQKKELPCRFAPDEHYLPVDVYLDKPACPEELLAKIQALLGERRDSPETPL